MALRIMTGDCRERLKDIADSSVDSVVCDPPYHLTSIVKRFGSETAAPAKAGKTGAYKRHSTGFMGQKWDGGDIAQDPAMWNEVLRVLKPGGHLVAFSGTRTYHRMVVAIEDAGFEIRDQLAWVFGSGFPKSHNLPGGLGTALKPSYEPICLASKPLIGTVAANVLAHGTGALNIDGCRIEAEGDRRSPCGADGIQHRTTGEVYGNHRKSEGFDTSQGRWPANLCHDGSEEVLAGFPDEAGAAAPVRGTEQSDMIKNAYSSRDRVEGAFHNDTGSAARFFYCAKAASSERGDTNNHPTVKPVALMQWLCRLVTPKGGTVLDPFMGSGSTLIAADAEQFNAIGIEMSPAYVAIAEQRIREAAGMFADLNVEAA